jgi:hypothetical protein
MFRGRAIRNGLGFFMNTGPKELEEHASAIGYLCIYYAELEDMITQLISRMSGLKGEKFDLFVNQIDLLKKLTVARGLAINTKAPSDWYTDLELLLIDIQKYIIPKRNRYVHDSWRVTMLPDTVTLRRTDKTKVAKPQSHRPPVLTTQEYTKTSAADIRQLSTDIVAVKDGVLILDDGFHSFQFKETPQLLPQHLRDELKARHWATVFRDLAEMGFENVFVNFKRETFAMTRDRLLGPNPDLAVFCQRPRTQIPQPEPTRSGQPRDAGRALTPN